MISLKVVGATRVANKLRSLVSQNDKIFGPVIEDYAKNLRKTLRTKKYPPKIAGQKYVRTGRLGSSYSARKVKPLIWEIGNSAKYAKYVVNEGTQAGIHAGRWYTIQSVERKMRPELTRNLVKRTEKHFGK